VIRRPEKVVKRQSIFQRRGGKVAFSSGIGETEKKRKMCSPENQLHIEILILRKFCLAWQAKKGANSQGYQLQREKSKDTRGMLGGDARPWGKEGFCGDNTTPGDVSHHMVKKESMQ